MTSSHFAGHTPGPWVVTTSDDGVGLLTDPWAWPVIDETFRKAATWWTWAWAG